MILVSLLILGFLILVLLFCGLMLVRNEVVYRARIKAIDIFYEAGGYSSNKSLAKYGSYTDMLYCFTKWTFEAFYPTLEEDLK